MTRSVADTALASWLIAAPPAAKFATICAVTAAGKGDTPCTVTPWLPANTSTSALSIRGGLRPHRASQATRYSSRPRLPGGLVNSAWRATTALAAA